MHDVDTLLKCFSFSTDTQLFADKAQNPPYNTVYYLWAKYRKQTGFGTKRKYTKKKLPPSQQQKQLPNERDDQSSTVEGRGWWSHIVPQTATSEANISIPGQSFLGTMMLTDVRNIILWFSRIKNYQYIRTNARLALF